MPIRKAPQPEEARKLFLTHPNKTLQDWADMWGTTAERVRQIRHESGVGAVFKLDMKVVEKVCEHISTGKFTLADREMYKSLPVGLEAFKTWMGENEQVMIAVTDAFILDNARTPNAPTGPNHRRNILLGLSTGYSPNKPEGCAPMGLKYLKLAIFQLSTELEKIFSSNTSTEAFVSP